ncbi:MAG: type II CRISPR-associated endonuclease Cas1 [Ruminococcaceae bacterium]|nr:type II CRISPR-associated endonuclease Cas1 [Oscillospiraceae bacterium]
MFRTIAIHFGERIGVRDNWLTVAREEGEHRIPIEDLYSVVIDNPQASLSVTAIHRLTDAGVHVLICNEKHQPVSVILPQNNHYRPLNVIRRQIELSADLKNALWDRIIRAKIENQAQVLRLCQRSTDRSARLMELAAEVTNGDKGNREGIAAKMFFRELYGFTFVRMHDDAINAALNYGYAIIRSACAKTLCAYGYNCVLGLHHINESNPFNLADDIMEPLRPLIDMWVDDNQEDLVDSLSRSHRNALAAIVNEIVRMDGKKMRLRNAIDKYVNSLTTAINKEDPSLLKIPQIIRTDLYRDEDEEEGG